MSLTGAQLASADSVDSLTTLMKSSEGKERVDILINLSTEYKKTDPLQAFLLSKEALEISEFYQYEGGLITSLSNLALYYKELGDYNKSIDFYQHANSILEKSSDQEGIGLGLINIGSVFALKRDQQNAIENYNNALEIFRKLDQPDQQIIILNLIGSVFEKSGEADKALDAYKKAQRIVEILGEDLYGAEVLIHIGDVYSYQKNLDESLSFYSQALEIATAREDKLMVALASHDVGETYLKMGKFDLSFRFLDRSIQISRVLKNRPLLTKSYATLAEVYFGRQEPIMAYLILKRQNAIKDSLFQEESDLKVAHLETLYELDEAQLVEMDKDMVELRGKSEKTKMILIILISVVVMSAIYGLYRNFISPRKPKTTG